MKTKTSIFLFILFSEGLMVQSLGQTSETIKDYFIPISGKNKAIYKLGPDKNGEATSIRIISYENKNGYYDVSTKTNFKGEIMSSEIVTVQFTNTEVRMISSVSSSLFGTDIQRSYSPPSVLLRMPSLGQTATWTAKISEDILKCSSSWTVVTVDNEQRKAIKVVRVTEILSGNETDYYVKGIGLWKIEFLSGDGTKETFCEFDRLNNEPEADLQNAARK